ncbi:DUF481 domain-containing protein [Vibrio bivalvicida]|uniref:DUF481 domain-containing protein n=1 Tax=Vibrio bivalvicida TaxID=1276888 RepID=UPI00352DD89F
MKNPPFTLAQLPSILSLLLLSSPSLAEEPENAQVEKSPFTAQTKLGFIYTENTSSSLSVNSALYLNYQQESWLHKASFESYYTDADNADDGANRYTVNTGSTYDFAEKTFVRGAARFENDLYGTYRKQWVLMTGLGVYLVGSDVVKTSISLGPGYRITQRQPFDSEYPDQMNYEVIASSTLDSAIVISERLSMGATLDVAHGEENTHYNTKAYIKNTLMANLSLVFDVEYIYNTTVAEDQSPDEIYSTMSLSYDF